jgi:hypothetical protein
MYVYACVRVRVYVCMFPYSSRTDIPICTKLGMLMPSDQEETLERSKLRGTVPSSSPGEGGSHSSGSKHNRKTAPRPKLFISVRRLQEQRPQPRKIVLGTSPDEDGFCYQRNLLFSVI